MIAGEPDKPDATSEKLPLATPVTGSLKVTFQCAEAALVGEASARVIEDTVGAVLSIAYVCPLNGIGGPNAFPARSLIPVPF